MERRTYIRVAVEQSVCVTSLRDRHVVMGKAVDLSGRGMRILLPSRLPPGDPIRMELEDALLLGEICYCRPEGDGFLAGVQLDQVLSGMAGLALLNRALLNAGAESETSALSYSVSE